MGTEIGARNFGDTYRYNMLPVGISTAQASQSRKLQKLTWGNFSKTVYSNQLWKLAIEINVLWSNFSFQDILLLDKIPVLMHLLRNSAKSFFAILRISGTLPFQILARISLSLGRLCPCAFHPWTHTSLLSHAGCCRKNGIKHEQ